jgi:hypothetical protein
MSDNYNSLLYQGVKIEEDHVTAPANYQKQQTNNICSLLAFYAA